jgi:hypothetical protein
MSDTTDDWAALKAHRQQERRLALEANLRKIADAGIQYRTSNNGVHCQAEGGGVPFDIWPSTEKWRVGGRGPTRNGIRQFITHYRAQQQLHEEAYVRAMERAFPHLKGEVK